MRRRERLTGFLIIFILLTFSAYSNSMNFGGREVINNNSNQSSQEVEISRNITYNNSNNRTEENSKINIQQNKEDIVQNRENDNNSVKVDNSSDNSSNLMVSNNKESIEIVDSTSIRDQAENGRQEEIFTGREERVEVRKPEPEPELIDQIEVHNVSSGETLWDIAQKHGVNIDTLIGANTISDMNRIQIGQELKVLPVRGILYRVSPGESVGSIANKFDVDPTDIMRDNNIKNSSSLKIDQNLIIRGAKPEFSYQDRLDQKLMFPINTRITSPFGPRWGRMHNGIDFAAPMGSPIRAASSGRVVYSGWANGYGHVVIIEHQKGLRTLYAHNSELLVREGEYVSRGQVITRSGNSGNSTGPHLHFEVQVNGRPENPLDYLNR